MKNNISTITILITISICFISFSIFILKYCKNYQDISGTVIAKSEGIESRYKSTRVYTEYVFAIHPDDGRLSDFDIKVPLNKYIKYNVGDKVVFHNRYIGTYIKDFKWYDNDRVWFTISLSISLIVLGYIFVRY